MCATCCLNQTSTPLLQRVRQQIRRRRQKTLAQARLAHEGGASRVRTFFNYFIEGVQFVGNPGILGVLGMRL